jgi:hypothetical protein
VTLRDNSSLQRPGQETNSQETNSKGIARLWASLVMPGIVLQATDSLRSTGLTPGALRSRSSCARQTALSSTIPPELVIDVTKPPLGPPRVPDDAVADRPVIRTIRFRR